MRLLAMTALATILAAAPASMTAAAQLPDSRTQLQIWDRCVGDNAQDYVDMFGAVSMDGDKLDKAVEDCWTEEHRYLETLQANPDLSDGVMQDAVASHRAQIRDKWFDVYIRKRDAAAKGTGR